MFNLKLSTNRSKAPTGLALDFVVDIKLLSMFSDKSACRRKPLLILALQTCLHKKYHCHKKTLRQLKGTFQFRLTVTIWQPLTTALLVRSSLAWIILVPAFSGTKLSGCCTLPPGGRLSILQGEGNETGHLQSFIPGVHNSFHALIENSADRNAFLSADLLLVQFDVMSAAPTSATV